MEGDNILTIIIPTCDRQEQANRLINKLQSIISDFIQIIIIDNGSKTFFLKQSNNKLANIRIIKTDPKIGASAARNIGLNLTNTKWITFIDDDDMIPDDYITEIISLINSNPKDSIFVFPLKKIINNKIIDYKKFPENKKKQRSLFYSNPGFGGQNVLYKTKVLIELNGFNEIIKSSEDRDLALRLIYKNYNIISMDRPYVILQDHSGDRLRNHGRLYGLIQFLFNHIANMTVTEIARFSVRYFDVLYRIYIRRKR